MKISLHPLVICFLIPLAMHSQKAAKAPQAITPSEVGVISATTESVLGTVQNISVKLIQSKNISSGTTSAIVRMILQDKNRYTPDAVTDLKTARAITEVIDAMATISNSVSNNGEIKGGQVVTKTPSGIEVGAFFMKQTAAETVQATRNEKSYVVTEAKQFEGKTVYEDSKGKFIWKTTSTTSTSDPGGQWSSYIQVEDHVPSSRVGLSTENFKKLSDLLARAKINLSNQ